MKKKIILLFIILFLFRLLISYLDYRGNSSPELHAEMLKYFTVADIEKGEAYSRSGFPVSVIRSIVLSFAVLIFAFSSISSKLEDLCARVSNNRFFVTSLLYTAVLYFLITVIFLPFNFYLSYVNEHSFGFSNMTAGFWLWTRLKSFFITLPFVSLSGAAVLLVIKRFKGRSVFIIPAGGLAAAFVMMILYPMFVLPLFYEIKPVNNPALEKKIFELAGRSGVDVDKIFVIKESVYSNHTNAFFVGFGSSKKIYLYDTLINKNSEPVVISILAHEIGHWAYNHNMKGLLAGFLLSIFGILVIYLAADRVRREPGVPARELHSPSIIPIYYLLFIIIMTFIAPVENAVSRTMERNADRYSIEVTGDPDTFISSQIRLARDNRSRLNKHPVSSFFRSSHPTAIERIEMAEIFKLKR